jgi:hypothetical protein
MQHQWTPNIEAIKQKLRNERPAGLLQRAKAHSSSRTPGNVISYRAKHISTWEISMTEIGPNGNDKA